jgi:hypothetical protein
MIVCCSEDEDHLLICRRPVITICSEMIASRTCILVNWSWQNKVPVSCIKGTLTRDFRPLVFFHRTTPPWPLIHGLDFLNMSTSSRRKSRKSDYSRNKWHALCKQCWRIFSRMIRNTVFYAEIWLGCTRQSGINDNAVTCTAVSYLIGSG